MWSIDLIAEIPAALAMGFVTKGVGTYFGLAPDVAFGVAIVVSQQGPRLIDSVVGLALEKARGKTSED